MRAFGIAVVLILLLAFVGAFGLNFMQEPSSIAYTTSGVRLDRVEAAVNDYARGVIPN
jgi:hypothetical protein